MEKPSSPTISMDKFDVTLLEEGIVENVVKPGAVMDMEDILKLKTLNSSITNGRRYCILVTAGYLSTITKEARELSASAEFSVSTIAKALLVSSSGQRMVGNFYLQVNKPSIKTKLFSDREKALNWLREELKNATNN